MKKIVLTLLFLNSANTLKCPQEQDFKSQRPELIQELEMRVGELASQPNPASPLVKVDAHQTSTHIADCIIRALENAYRTSQSGEELPGWQRCVSEILGEELRTFIAQLNDVCLGLKKACSHTGQILESQARLPEHVVTLALCQTILRTKISIDQALFFAYLMKQLDKLSKEQVTRFYQTL